VRSIFKPHYSTFDLTLCYVGYFILTADTSSLNRIMWTLALFIFWFGADFYYGKPRAPLDGGKDND